MRSASRAARPRTTLGAGAVGARSLLGVHVLDRVLGPRVRLALRLRYRGLDLGVELATDRVELLALHTLLPQVFARAVERVLRHPLADLVFRAIAAVVVIGRVRLVAVALELHQRRTSARACALDGLPRLIKGVEHVHAVGDEPSDPITRGLVGDV